MKSLLVGCLLLASCAAAEAQTQITITSKGGAQASRSLTLGAAASARILAWAKATFGPEVVEAARLSGAACEVEPVPADCKPTTREITDDEAMARAIQSLLDDIRHRVLLRERAKAARDAQDAVEAIRP